MVQLGAWCGAHTAGSDAQGLADRWRSSPRHGSSRRVGFAPRTGVRTRERGDPGALEFAYKGQGTLAALERWLPDGARAAGDRA